MDPNDVLNEMAPAAESAAWVVDFLLWLAAAVGFVVVLFACRLVIQQVNAMSGQRDFPRIGRMFLAGIVLGAPLLFADVIKQAIFGSDGEAHEAPKGVEFLEAPFGAPPPQ